MTGSIEGLLQTAAEKKRLEEELRIARAIQMSLLPTGPLDVPGLGITALCVPAREVGGDYYDFFHLPGGRLGVLIADVSGKGTSAALYMAELKGLVLALSQRYDSPRELLIEVNRIISETPRQPQLHHHDLRGHRRRAERDDLLPRRPHAADLPVGAVVAGTPLRAGADAERHGAGPAHPRRRGEVRGAARGAVRRPRGRRRHRALHRRHHGGDEPRERSVRRDAPQPASSRSTATSSRASCGSASSARSRHSSAPPISMTT